MRHILCGEGVVLVPIRGVCITRSCYFGAWIRKLHRYFQSLGPNIGPLKAEAIRRTQRALHLERMVVGTAAVREQIGTVELRIGDNPVLREQPCGYSDSSRNRGSARHVESQIGP